MVTSFDWYLPKTYPITESFSYLCSTKRMGLAGTWKDTEDYSGSTAAGGRVNLSSIPLFFGPGSSTSPLFVIHCQSHMILAKCTGSRVSSCYPRGVELDSSEHSEYWSLPPTSRKHPPDLIQILPPCIAAVPVCNGMSVSCIVDRREFFHIDMPHKDFSLPGSS